MKDDPADAVDFVEERLGRACSTSPWSSSARRARAAVRRARSDRPPGGGARAAAPTEEFERAYVAYDRANRLAGKADGAAPALDRGWRRTTRRSRSSRRSAERRRDRGGAPGEGLRGGARGSAELGPPVDRFFDEVLVMAEDAQVRANRLRLLLDVRDAVGALGDLSQTPR